MSSGFVTNERFNKLDDRVTVLEVDVKKIKVQVDNHAQVIGTFETLREFVSPSLMQYAKAHPGLATAEMAINLVAVADNSEKLIKASKIHLEMISPASIKKGEVAKAVEVRETDENKLAKTAAPNLATFTPTLQDNELPSAAEELTKNSDTDTKSALKSPITIRAWFIKHYNPTSGGTGAKGEPISFCQFVIKQHKELFPAVKALPNWDKVSKEGGTKLKNRDNNAGVMFNYLKDLADKRTSETAKYAKYYDIVEKAYKDYLASSE